MPKFAEFIFAIYSFQTNFVFFFCFFFATDCYLVKAFNISFYVMSLYYFWRIDAFFDASLL